MIRIGFMYPELLGDYGEAANVKILEKRMSWRGIECQVVKIGLGDDIDFDTFDILTIGGGVLKNKEAVMNDLSNRAEAFSKYIEDGGVLLATCDGMELLGNEYGSEDGIKKGLGILQISTKWDKERLVRNIILESEICKKPIIGFENHAGRLDIGNYKPLGKVFYGLGNTGNKDFEGVIYKNVIGTYIHGPLLAKNPELADYLISKALEKKGEPSDLSELDDIVENQANDYLYEKYSDKKNVMSESLKRKF